jgi:hypothetical protein
MTLRKAVKPCAAARGERRASHQPGALCGGRLGGCLQPRRPAGGPCHAQRPRRRTAGAAIGRPIPAAAAAACQRGVAVEGELVGESLLQLQQDAGALLAHLWHEAVRPAHMCVRRGICQHSCQPVASCGAQLPHHPAAIHTRLTRSTTSAGPVQYAGTQDTPPLL